MYMSRRTFSSLGDGAGLHTAVRVTDEATFLLFVFARVRCLESCIAFRGCTGCGFP